MEKFQTLEELEGFERRWKIISTCFCIVFAGALLEHLLRSPRGGEALWCYSVGAFAFIGALWSVRRIGDGEREAGLLGGLELLGEDLSVGDVDD
ncbi:hypothetical protein [Pseudoduganella violaceinigra]|uniref:hypothetical protein n=1 Tax=Pseudoduganella violaceinigra TaxID=246602 RepID=UPI00041C7B1B|nr:hypothetical protein [Pseudoduganella violaceinigra]